MNTSRNCSSKLTKLAGWSRLEITSNMLTAFFFTFWTMNNMKFMNGFILTLSSSWIFKKLPCSKIWWLEARKVDTGCWESCQSWDRNLKKNKNKHWFVKKQVTRQHSTQSVRNMPPPSPRHLLPHVLQIMPKNANYDQFQPKGHHNEENPQSMTKMPGNPKFYLFHEVKIASKL